jgi:hypothetical protein
MTPYRVGFSGPANLQKSKYKIFKKIPILAHSAKKIPKVKTSKISPGYPLSQPWATCGPLSSFVWPF